MAVEVKVNAEQEVKREYPYLGKSHTGQVVLFIKETTGTNVNGIGCVLGHYSDNWAEWSFFPLSTSASITLSNKA